MKVLLAGSNGQLGRCFQDRLPFGWQILATDSTELDITDLAQVTATVSAFKPNAIVNSAAYTAVDKAESEVAVAERINAVGPANLASVATQHGIRLVHVSTDYVFDGNTNTPYTEESVTNPLSVYGITKLVGERAVSAAAPDAIIVRTAWVFSEYGNNFVKTMLRLGKERDALSIVDDQRGCPTYAGDLAQAIIALLQQNAAGGIYHYAGDKEVSWFEFAQAIFSVAVQKAVLSKAPTLTPITTAQYPTPAHRPAYSTLAGEKVMGLGIALSDWQGALKKTI
ncbi:dTDP-4-dehydrorhamnose reductase [Candidatus Symbiopectobacterium sp. 'North America']|uniref:dTDP-4-dehydrorhamnose reductase n=1 Tax=Candidatus Symbiopectobacterium sp. 'North America' TaxID=2794574 RepID=UPI0018C96F53|nr:dTDP-4-dehydrorhamnose reductase [Candidatus Symbiopectobacterium sp. 'North America']MBG6244351.1 dTDP-4-dehydrorhamnose reductase [Candidatus Symbiopectobacterium sp. 'North America']